MSRGFAAVGLYAPKNLPNIGGVLRAAHCYDVAMVAVQGRRYRRQASDTTYAERHLPVLEVASLLDAIPRAARPIAVELCDGAKDLRTFVHPHSAFYIFGPEDGSIPNSILDRCWAKVMIPTRFCMNLAATVNVVLYDRFAKRRA